MSKIESTERDPNAELRSFEPLRVTLALGALLLGLILGMHWIGIGAMHTNIFKLSAVEGMGASGAKGTAPDAGQEDPDPDWQPV